MVVFGVLVIRPFPAPLQVCPADDRVYTRSVYKLFPSRNPARSDYEKPTAWITSPRVRDAARAHFGCPTLLGVALEDLPFAGAFGQHWEARMMGPEARLCAGCWERPLCSQIREVPAFVCRVLALCVMV